MLIKSEIKNGSRSCPSADGRPEPMKKPVIPNEVRNLALVLFWFVNSARFLTSFGMTALFQMAYSR